MAGAIGECEYFFRMAMQDYASALRDSQDAFFYCYRALETLKQSFGGGWGEMHRKLGTNRCVIKTLIKQHADQIRHGNPPIPEQMLQRQRTLFHALKYVRDTLLAFLIRRTPSLNQKTPILDLSRVPESVSIKCGKSCECKT